MIIEYSFIVLFGALMLLSFVIFLDNERMLKDIIENPLPPPKG